MMPPSHNQTLCLIILAAGESRRFGTAKQLAVFNGETLLERTLRNAEIVQARLLYDARIVIVLGAHADEIRAAIDQKPNQSTPTCTVIINHEWESGMATSIRCGIKEAQRQEATAVLMLSCDQILVDADHLMNLIRTYTEGKATIVASRYGETIGIPALFAARYYHELLVLEGDVGAKSLLKKHETEVISLHFDQAGVDIDTQEQLVLAQRSSLDHRK